MKSRSTNPVKPFTIAFGIAFSIVILIALYFALVNGRLDVRSRAAIITKYTCVAQRECRRIGTVVSTIYCGRTCVAPNECCKTTMTIADTPTPTPTPPTAIACQFSCVSSFAACKAAGGLQVQQQCSDSGVCCRLPKATPTPTKAPTPTSSVVSESCSTAHGWPGTCQTSYHCSTLSGYVTWDSTVTPCKNVSGYGCCGMNPDAITYDCQRCSNNYDYTWVRFLSTTPCDQDTPILQTRNYTCNCNCGISASHQTYGNCTTLCSGN